MSTELKPHILIVDDNLEMAHTLADGLEEHGYDAVAQGSGRKALEWLAQHPCDALVTDLRMSGVDGLQLLTASRKECPERPVIVMTAYSAVDSAIECIRQGAYHYLTKPFKLDELVIFLQRALAEARVRREASALKTTLRERFSRSSLIGSSAPMQVLRDLLDRLADTLTPVLLGGETGTGKGLVARILHVDSQRAAGPFIPVNCAALPETLLESELFGHERGAFTGATASRRGLFAEADGGTLFLDEIGEMTLPLQAKLLHVLESGSIRPLGRNREQKVDVRIVVATHRDLQAAVRQGSFRQDLFYRLDVVTVELPALRHRREDLPELLEHFLRLSRGRHPESRVERFSADALSALLAYDWPGNVRELAHTVERAVILSPQPEVPLALLPEAMRSPPGSRGPTFAGDILCMRELQRRYAAWAVAQLGGNKRRTAEKLDVDQKTLGRLLAEEEESSAAS